MPDQPITPASEPTCASVTEAEERCTLSSQAAQPQGLETLPDGERARYSPDYDNPHFPGHWGEEDQGMTSTARVQPSQPAVPTRTVNHCTGVFHNPDGSVTQQEVSRATPPIPRLTPDYPC